MGAVHTGEPFDVTAASTWLARGRSQEHAEALAQIWRELPDLPSGTPAKERMERIRARAIAMKPLNEAISAETEAERQRRNFAFVESKAADPTISDRDLAILRARDEHGFNWDQAIRYADGWYAAHEGWPYRPPSEHARSGKGATLLAYDRGFADGGGSRSDLFDAARRAFRAEERKGNQPVAQMAAAAARPLPSEWPLPNDHPRPARWESRLLIISTCELMGPFLDEIQAASNEGLNVVVIKPASGFAPLTADLQVDTSLAGEDAELLISDLKQADQLRTLINGRDLQDILIAAQGDYLRIVDAHSAALPLCRNMERTRNTAIQQ